MYLYEQALNQSFDVPSKKVEFLSLQLGTKISYFEIMCSSFGFAEQVARQRTLK